MVAIEAATGRVIDSFEHSEKSSGISQEMAKQRTEGFLANYLSKRKLSL